MGRKNTILIILAIFIVIAAFALAEYRNMRSRKVLYTATVTATTTPDISLQTQNEDSDGDGLKDWEEVLIGTNPKNADSDGDGLADGKEKMSDSPNVTKMQEVLTPTDMMARDFFARYMELHQVGLSTDKQSQEELVGTVLKNGLVLSSPKIYTAKDILIASLDDRESIKKYGNDVGSIFIKYAIKENKNEAAIAKDSLEKEDPEILKEIDPIIASYKKILAELRKAPAPQSISATHLGLINSMSKILFSAESLRKTDADPLSGIQGASLYLEALGSLNKSFNDLKNNFSAKEIAYTANEPGGFFVP